VRLQPRAGRDEIVSERGGRVVARVTAPPLDGRANAALVALVAKLAGVPKRSVTIVRGQRSRDKLLRIGGVADDELRRALGLSSG